MRLVVAIAWLAGWPLLGQTAISLKDRAQFDQTFEHVKGDKLKCDVRSIEPWVDFGFRFVLRYGAECEVKQFGGVESDLKAYLRVRPEGRAEQVFGDEFLISAAPKGFDLDNLKHLHSALQFSGAIAAGMGAYELDLLLVDNHDRVYRKHWKEKAFPRGRERDLNFSMPPNTLSEMRTLPIPPKSAAAKGGPLTVMINAAPLFPWARKLRAWDRAFLLDSLSSLLREISYTSVRVIAFNLDQQQEIFRQENFSQRDMPKLNEALRRLELGKIAYSTLEHKEGWAELLLALVKKEGQAEQPPQALVFLGPTLRLSDKVPTELLAAYQAPTLPVFCVTYYPRIGADFPDSIQHLTTSLKGKVFRIHTPTELAQNLEKLKHAMQVTAQ